MAETQQINGKVVRVTVHLRDQTTKILDESVKGGDGNSSGLKPLSESLLTMQQKLNTFLTGLVEQERGTTSNVTVNNADEEGKNDGYEEQNTTCPPKCIKELLIFLLDIRQMAFKRG